MCLHRNAVGDHSSQNVPQTNKLNLRMWFYNFVLQPEATPGWGPLV